MIENPAESDPATFEPKADTEFAGVTISQFCDLSGKTFQISGVLPDIELPGYLQCLVFKEADYPFVLKPSVIPRTVAFDPDAKLPFPTLLKASSSRIARDASFRQLKVLNDKAGFICADTIEIPLDVEGFFERLQQEQELLNQIETVTRHRAVSFKVCNNKAHAQLVDVDSRLKKQNETLLEEMSADLFLDETFRITIDLIGAQKK